MLSFADFLAEEQEKILYHGTMLKNLKMIQKQGLLPHIGKNKEEGEDDDVRVPAVHLTKNLTAAKWYATGGFNAKGGIKNKTKGVVLGVDVNHPALQHHKFVNDRHEIQSVMTPQSIPPAAIVSMQYVN